MQSLNIENAIIVTLEKVCHTYVISSKKKMKANVQTILPAPTYPLASTSTAFLFKIVPESYCQSNECFPISEARSRGVNIFREGLLIMVQNWFYYPPNFLRNYLLVDSLC